MSLGFALVFLAGLIVGWTIKNPSSKAKSLEETRLEALRMSGYKFISPLLACDTSYDGQSNELNNLENKIRQSLDRAKVDKNIDIASVFYREFSTGYTLDINPEEKYYPASLNKIPVMMSAYKIAETNPGILAKKIQAFPDKDTNINLEIFPRSSMKPGEVNTIQEAIDKMIKFSDNNAFYALAENIDVDVFKSTFRDLQIPIREDASAPADYMTAKDFSYFLRVLYNSTYLRRDFSEKSLKSLSEVDFKEGLVAGLPREVTVSHKFGIKTDFQKQVPRDRELHDCGIIYHSERPYLLCVMTKSSGTLEGVQKTIKEISQITYADVERRSKNKK